jgi:hypothetical protein
LVVTQEREEERELLRRELAKSQDQIRRFFRGDTAAGTSPPQPGLSGGATSRPHSFISVGSSDPMDLDSDHVMRPHSLLSLDSDTADGTTTSSEDDHDAGGLLGAAGDGLEPVSWF